VLVRGDDLDRVAGLDALAADHGGDHDGFAAHLLNPLLERAAFRGAGGVGADGLVNGDRGLEDGVGHGVSESKRQSSDTSGEGSLKIRGGKRFRRRRAAVRWGSIGASPPAETVDRRYFGIPCYRLL
jgi:hypothetical protein